MLRILLQYLLPLLLPFLLYFAWAALTRAGARRAGSRSAPWAHLLGAGVLLMALSLIAWSLLSGASPEAVYLPPRFEDGRVVPGTCGRALRRGAPADERPLAGRRPGCRPARRGRC